MICFYYNCYADIPEAHAGNDTVICGSCGYLNAIPSVGTGTWSSSHPDLITFSDVNNPNSQICSQVFNSGNHNLPHFYVIWTEATEVISDSDTIKVQFIQIPESDFSIIPPRCRNERARVIAINDTLPNYSWDFYHAIIDSTPPANNSGGNFLYYIKIPDNIDITLISLTTTNQWGCQSIISTDSVINPEQPEWGYSVINDYCVSGDGAIIMDDIVYGNVFYLLDDQYDQISSANTVFSNLGGGIYNVRARYPTQNQNWESYYLTAYGDAMCTDTIKNIAVLPLNTDEINIYYPEICLVTTTSDNCNKVIWDNSGYPEIEFFYVFRKDSDNDFINIGQVQTSESAVFIDCEAQPNLHSYRYIISSDPYCVEASQYHNYTNSINLQVEIDDTDRAVLKWNSFYGSNNISSVEILRGLLPEEMSVIETVSPLDTIFHDEFLVSGLIYYQLKLNVTETCSADMSYDYINSNIATNDENFYGYSESFKAFPDISVIPNPAKDFFRINTTKFPLDLTLFDLSGKSLYSKENYYGEEIDVSSLSPGIYFLQIRVLNRISRLKVIVY